MTGKSKGRRYKNVKVGVKEGGVAERGNKRAGEEGGDCQEGWWQLREENGISVIVAVTGVRNEEGGGKRIWKMIIITTEQRRQNVPPAHLRMAVTA